MFRESNKDTQLDIFSSPTSHLPETLVKKLNDPHAWFNIFRETVTNRIDETIFSPLFSEGKGAPNASIKRMVAMMILKEAERISDEKLYESCTLNIATRWALGLYNLNDTVPVLSTYI